MNNDQKILEITKVMNEFDAKEKDGLNYEDFARHLYPELFDKIRIILKDSPKSPEPSNP